MSQGYSINNVTMWIHDSMAGSGFSGAPGESGFSSESGTSGMSGFSGVNGIDGVVGGVKDYAAFVSSWSGANGTIVPGFSATVYSGHKYRYTGQAMAGGYEPMAKITCPSLAYSSSMNNNWDNDSLRANKSVVEFQPSQTGPFYISLSNDDRIAFTANMWLEDADSYTGETGLPYLKACSQWSGAAGATVPGWSANVVSGKYYEICMMADNVGTSFSMARPNLSKVYYGGSADPASLDNMGPQPDEWYRPAIIKPSANGVIEIKLLGGSNSFNGAFKIQKGA